MPQTSTESAHNEGQVENAPVDPSRGSGKVCRTPFPERLRTGNYWGLSGARQWQGEPGARQFEPPHSRRSNHRTVTGRMAVKVGAEPPRGPKQRFLTPWGPGSNGVC